MTNSWRSLLMAALWWNFSIGLLAQDLSHLPRFQIQDLTYEGAFRIPARDYGNSDINYSEGPIAYNPDNHSLFVVGHAHQQAIGEFAIPELVRSEVLADLNFSPDALQPFRSFLGATPDGNPEGIDRIGGMLYVTARKQPQLIVNGYEYYDAPGDNTVTTLLIDDAADLQNSTSKGYLTFAGGAGHTSGWLSPVPVDLQGALGGDHLTGQSSGRPITSRFSVGPTAFTFNLADLLGSADAVPTTKLLDFSLANRLHPDLANDSLQNDVWTHLSKATYGFIVPGTRTYVTLGKSGGHTSGVCYKCTQDDGHLCGGYCSPAAADNHQYYWLWDLQDLVNVKNGTVASYDVRPYDYGIFDTPFNDIYHGIGGGSFDPVTGNLYLTIQKGDTEQGTYARPPVVVVYQINSVVSSTDETNKTDIRVFPNPAREQVTIANLRPGTEITFMNMLGAVVGTFATENSSLKINTADFPRGVYLVHFQGRNTAASGGIRVVLR